MADGANIHGTSDERRPLPVVRRHGLPDGDLSKTESESETRPVRSTKKMARSWEGRSKTYVAEPTPATRRDMNKSGVSSTMIDRQRQGPQTALFVSSAMIDRQRQGPQTALFALASSRTDSPSEMTNGELPTPDNEIPSVTSATDTKFPRLQLDKHHRSGKVWLRPRGIVLACQKFHILTIQYLIIFSHVCECRLYVCIRIKYDVVVKRNTPMYPHLHACSRERIVGGPKMDEINSPPILCMIVILISPEHNIRLPDIGGLQLYTFMFN